MQSIEEHQDFPKGDAFVMPVGEPRKRRSVCNVAAERCQKMEERTRGNRGYRRKSAVACRKLSNRVSDMAKTETREEDSDPGKL
jgi:hypothetical protein